MKRSNLALLVTIGCVASAPIAAAATLADVPLETVSGLPLVEVRIGNSDQPLAFLIDTGFDASILDAGVATGLGLEAQAAHDEAQPGGTIQVAQLPATTLSIGDQRIPDVSLTAIAIAPMSTMLGRPFHGIIGHDVLARFVVDLDFPAGRLRLSDPATWRPPAGSTFIDVTIRDSQPLAVGAIVTSDGREVPALLKIDTGSLDIAGLNLNFVRDNGIVPPGAAELKVGGVGVGGETEGRLFRAGALVLGPHRVERPLLGYTTDSAGFENRNDAGTVGAGVLATSRLILDYPHGRIAFVGEAATPTEDHTGMMLVAPGPEHTEVWVAQVNAESPAAAAGLAAGDRLLALGGESNPSLSVARAAQHDPGDLEVTFVRDGKQHQTVIHRRPLLP